MEIGVLNNINNINIGGSSATDSPPRPLNAFGIGTANRPEVEISAQARILQQNEQTQQQRSEALNQTGDQPSEETQAAISGTEFIRVSSSVGSAARNNLSTEQATEVYRSIQDLL
ncbi:MAG: hypothetical protein Alis3KO_14040 [Aliiglaciecola sp.]|uniref:hypothetical protein n=1 Tax=Aliiglaciecola sp. M165 TaxID=2593649 RepID=UPI00117E4EB4|nr:hypothetical protein [Aliiglaciecola sp. M165]TRY32908.1 hypothetical protein FM019_02660 [Aliiglaciecola sp. M165]